MIVKFTCLLPFLVPRQACRLLTGALALALALILTSPALAVQDTPADIPAKKQHSAYLQDGKGVIVRSGSGLCWRSGYWTPEDAVAGCDGPLVPPVSKIIAPPWPDQPTATVTTEAAAVSIPTRPASCSLSSTLGADAAFAFGGAELSTVARRQIDTEVLRRLASCPPSASIRITGHTDRLGSPQYNRALSLRRARAVAEYLQEHGVKLRLEAVGAGASQAQQQCNNQKNRTALLACLASDRKVTIELHGTQD